MLNLYPSDVTWRGQFPLTTSGSVKSTNMILVARPVVSRPRWIAMLHRFRVGGRKDRSRLDIDLDNAFGGWRGKGEAPLWVPCQRRRLEGLRQMMMT